ncbi:MAG TPA: LysM peptidoglycan-binding domain-containing protein, partial [Polyangiaceae bacterium]|nr:LysM peptidoglycan-binding domain-containing protein [Polyangiaceae bacterium]
QVASRLQASLDDGDGPSLARLEIVGRGSQSLGTIEKEVEAQIDLLAKQGPKLDELAKVERALRQRELQELSSSEQRARQLARGRLLGRSAESILAPLDEQKTESEPNGEAVRSAVARYLGVRSRSVVEVYPKGWQDPWQAPMPLFHVVSPGESLGSIAKQYGTTVIGLRQMNKGLDTKQPIYPGDKLRVPRLKGAAEAKPLLHKVARGDTLGGLALRYGVTVKDIAEANGMSPKQSIRTGEELRIPRLKKDAASKDSKDPKAEPSHSTGPAKPVGRTHQVKAGETLSGIAAKLGVSAVKLAQANGMSQKSMVKVGQVLLVPEPEVAAVRAEAAPAAGPADAPKKPDAPRVTHKVRTGETPSGIAKKYGVSVSSLLSANGLQPKSVLQPGQTLTIPRP